MPTNMNASATRIHRRVSDSITRPANTTAYASGDVVSEVTSNEHFTFQMLTPGRKQTGTIVSAVITDSLYAATGPDLELWLFNKDIANVADNEPAAITDAEIANLVGIIDIPTASWQKPGAANNAQVITGLNLPFRCLDSNMYLYGQLIIRNTYTPPGNSEVITVYLDVSED